MLLKNQSEERYEGAVVRAEEDVTDRKLHTEAELGLDMKGERVVREVCAWMKGVQWEKDKYGTLSFICFWDVQPQLSCPILPESSCLFGNSQEEF